MNSIYIILFILLGIIVGFLLFAFAKTYFAEKIQQLWTRMYPRLKYKTDEVDFVLHQALKELSCEPELMDPTKRSIGLVYHGLHFVIDPIDRGREARVLLLHNADFPITQLSSIRAAVNLVNLNADNVRAIYTFDHDQNTIDVHITSGFEVPNTVEECTPKLRKLFDEFLHHRMGLFGRVQEMTINEEMYGVDDWEMNGLRKAADLSGIKKEEASHFFPAEENRVDASRSLFLVPFLERICEGGLPKVSELKVVTDECEILTEEQEIRDFDFLKTIVARDEQGNAHLVNQIVTLLIKCSVDNSGTVRNELLTLTLQAERETQMAYYVRATVSRLPVPEQSIEFMTDEMIFQESASVLLGVAKLSEERRMMEFEYMWQDACDKLANNELDEMTEEQKFIAMFNKGRNISSGLYWGLKYFFEKRYYESIPYLESVFESLSQEMHLLNNKHKSMFYEICYRIGYAYCDLKLYKDAYYYLDIIANVGSTKYMMEYVNCLVNSKDYRALTAVENYLKQIDDFHGGAEAAIKDNSMTEETQEFYNFLRRRKAYLLVELSFLDEAELYLKSMLHDSNNGDFALNELAYIQRMKKSEDDEDAFDAQA